MNRIIFVNRYFYPDYSATSQLLTDLAFNLANLYEVHVVTSRQLYDDPGVRLPHVTTAKKVNIWRVWSSRFGRRFLPARAFDYLTFYAAALKMLCSLTQSGDIVVAKTDPPLISFVAALACRARGAQLINWLQDLFPEIARALEIRGSGPLFFLLSGARNWSLGQARMNVVLGSRMARVIRDLPGGCDMPMEVIHNWSDGDEIYPVAMQDNPLRNEWALKDRFVIGYSGNMGRVHELCIILEAARQLSGDPRFVFLFIGGGARQAELEDIACVGGLQNVMFRPYQPRCKLIFSLGVCNVHIVSLLPKLEGYVVPSKFYGVAAAGRPVVNIGDKDGEIARIITEAECGATFEPNDAVGIARFIKSLADDEMLWSRYARKARLVFEDRYNKHKALRRWNIVISSLVNR